MDNQLMKRTGIIFLALVALTFGMGLAPLGVTFNIPQKNIGDTVSLRNVFEGYDLGTGPYELMGGRTITYDSGSFLRNDLKTQLLDVFNCPGCGGDVIVFTFYCGNSNPTTAWAKTAYTDGIVATKVAIKPAGTYTDADITGPTVAITPEGLCTIVSGTYSDPFQTPKIVNKPYTIWSNDNPVGNSYNFKAVNYVLDKSSALQIYYTGYLPVGGTTFDPLVDANQRFVAIEIDTGDGGDGGGTVIIPGQDWWARLGIADKNTKIVAYLFALLGISYAGARATKF